MIRIGNCRYVEFTETEKFYPYPNVRHDLIIRIPFCDKQTADRVMKELEEKGAYIYKVKKK